MRLLAPELLDVALQLQHARPPLVASIVEVRDALILFHQLEPLFDRGGLRLRRRDLFVELLNALANDADGAVVGAPAGCAKSLRCVSRASATNSSRCSLSSMGSRPPGGPAVRRAASQPRLDRDKLAGQLPELRVRLGGVENCQRLAGADDILVLRRLVEDAAFQMLYGLTMAVDDGRSGSDDRAVEIGQQRPADKPPKHAAMVTSPARAVPRRLGSASLSSSERPPNAGNGSRVCPSCAYHRQFDRQPRDLRIGGARHRFALLAQQLHDLGTRTEMLDGAVAPAPIACRPRP